MKYSVGWLQDGEPRKEQLAVWERNLSAKVPVKQRFQWFYRDNPAGAGRLALLEARDGDDAPAHVVGTAGHGMRLFQAGGSSVRRTLRAALIADVAIDAAHRGAIPAIILTKEMRRFVLREADLAYGFPNRMAAPLVIKVGYRKLGETRRFALAFRHQRLLQPRMSSPVAARAAALLLDAARACLVGARAVAPLASYRLSWPTEVDDRFDRLWREAAPGYRFIGVRDAAFVRWRFLSPAAGPPLRLATMEHRRTGEIAGYAAFERDGTTVHLRDVFAKRDLLPSFLRLLSGAFWLRGASSISIRLLGASALAAALQEVGFRAREDKCTVVCSAGLASGADAEAFSDVDDWYLTDADEDA